MSSLTYAQSGVNRSLADRFVQQIGQLTKSTHSSRVKASLGGYASLYALNQDQWIAAATDGVGTKLKLAFELKKHSSVGIDLVAMCVNDLLCVGAEPLFFLDYIATGKLLPKIAFQIVEGITEGCQKAGCALVGGETAEMPGFYSQNEYDLAGFAVGTVEKKKVLPKKTIRTGDILLGISSSGFHSNGFSLLRKLLPMGRKRKALAKMLLEPTEIYVSALRKSMQQEWIKAGAHITGSGFLNLPRVSERFNYEIELPPLQERPDCFGWLEKQEGLTFQENCQTFNMGVGMILVVDPARAAQVLRSVRASGMNAWRLGHVTPKKRGQKETLVRVKDRNNECLLEY